MIATSPITIFENDSSNLNTFCIHPAGFNANMFKPLEKSLSTNIYSYNVVGHGNYWVNNSHQKEFNWSKNIEILSNIELPKFENSIGVSMGASIILIAYDLLLSRNTFLFEPILPFTNSIKSTRQFLHDITFKRKNEWDSIEQAKNYLREKNPYTTLDKNVLEDFLDDAFYLNKKTNLVHLSCDPKWESQIYNTDSNLTKETFENKVNEINKKTNLYLILSKNNSVYNEEDKCYLQNLNINVLEVDTNHFCILENIKLLQDLKLL